MKMAKRRKSGIKIKPSKQGSLRKATGTKKGQKIPAAKLQKMKKSSSPAMRRKANFAINARKWSKGKKKS